MPYNFTTVEKKWQDYWLRNKSFRALDPLEAGAMPKKYVLDMFPYPSGDGLHVGHPEGYTATDIYSRYLRMTGHNVLHAMGWDAFGLPAEQYAIQNNVQPAVTTQKNINNFRRQIQALGLSYDWDREVDTTDPRYYKWTQWIFLRLYNSYFDPFDKKAKPVGHLIAELQNDNLLIAPDGSIHINPTQEGLEAITGDQSMLLRTWKSFAPEEQRDIIDGQRLAYIDDVPVWWCAGLGTVLANEEVIDGKSERGSFPVERRPMRQWMLRITAYADRLIDDLALVEWPESIKEMQRNWIGRSTGAEVDFDLDGITDADGNPETITVFTTRPDTLYGATYMVLAPEHELVDAITTPGQRAEVEAYRKTTSSKSERDRMADVKEKTGVFTGAYAINPVNDKQIPVWIADYVLTGYGTGAIMAVPAHDERDFAFAQKFDLPIVHVVKPLIGTVPQDEVFVAEGYAFNSGPLNELSTLDAKTLILDRLEEAGTGRRKINYKLRDWLFSRQRYWGEPFPIVLDTDGNHFAVDDSELPVELPQVADFRPTGTPEPPLTKATEWLHVERGGRPFIRETNTMPQWAGSCWYYLRYIDPDNDQVFVGEDKEHYWMPVDLYVGGVEHAVLHLLYARFWQKVLFDLNLVSTPEPFKRLVNQGLILGETEYHFFEDDNGKPITATEFKDIDEEATDRGVRMFGTHIPTGRKLYATRVIEPLVDKKESRHVLKANPSIVIDARSFKMSKSRKNVVNPDTIVSEYGADCFRLYEMYMGPLEAQKPWNTRDITGMYRFLGRVWATLVGDDEAMKFAKITDAPPSDALDRQLHRAIRKVGEDIEGLRFNTAIAELIILIREMSGLEEVPRRAAETFVLLLAPFAPHQAEEIWQRLGHADSLARHAWPAYDADKLIETTIELPVQVNGKLRDRIFVAADAEEEVVFSLAEASEKVQPWINEKTVVKRMYVPKRMVTYVVKD